MGEKDKANKFENAFPASLDRSPLRGENQASTNKRSLV
jgi:hypothetical protein